MGRLFEHYAEFLESEVRYAPGLDVGPVRPWNDIPRPGARPPFPRDPSAPGHAPGTMAQWDWIASAGLSAERKSGDVKATSTPARLRPRRGCNRLWTDRVRSAHLSGSMHLLAASEAVPTYDFRLEDPVLYQAAHSLAHRRMEDVVVATACADQIHNMLAEEYHKACAELVLSELYGIPVDVSTRGRDVPMAYGVMARPCTATGFDQDFPVLRMPCRSVAKIAHRTGLYVLVVLYIGHDPVPESDFENMFSYRPVSAVVAGSETPAYLSLSQLIWPDRGYYEPDRWTGDFACPVQDLLPGAALDEYLETARHNVAADRSYMRIRDWVTTEDYAQLSARTPAQPCPMCLYTDCGYAEGLSLPSRKRQDTRKDKKWKAYFKSLGIRLRTVRSALSDERAAHRGRTGAFKNRILAERARKRRIKRW